MLAKSISRLQRRPVPVFSLVLFLVCTAFMAWMRLGMFANSIVNVGYGLPLLVCLWYPDKRLLWALMGTYMIMAAYIVFVIAPGAFSGAQVIIWGMQMFNMLVIGLSVHLAIDLLNKLRRNTSELEATNQELKAREEEISRQNEELQSQSEELAQQNEEIQQQAEELQAQSGDLQRAIVESHKRQSILEAMLESLRSNDTSDLPVRICHLLISLMGKEASAAVILEKEGSDLVVLAQAGPISLPTRRWPFDRSFAAVVMGANRTACVPDLSLRP
jgi:Skp family chaperone for outer membrane proteins